MMTYDIYDNTWTRSPGHLFALGCQVMSIEAICNLGFIYKKAQLSLTNPRNACEKFARFT